LQGGDHAPAEALALPGAQLGNVGKVLRFRGPAFGDGGHGGLGADQGGFYFQPPGLGLAPAPQEPNAVRYGCRQRLRLPEGIARQVGDRQAQGLLNGGQDVDAVAVDLGWTQGAGLFQFAEGGRAGFSQPHQGVVVEDLEQGAVPVAGDLAAQLQQLLEHRQPAGIEFSGALAGGEQGAVFAGRRANFAQQPALLLQPAQTVLGGQLGLQRPRQRQQETHIGGGIGQHLFRQRPARPILALVFLVQRHAEELRDDGFKAGLLEPEQTAGALGVEKVADADVEVAIKAAHVVVGAMKDFADVGAAKGGFQGGQVGERHGVDDHVAVAAGQLQQADLFLEMVHGVGLEVDAEGGFRFQLCGQG